MAADVVVKVGGSLYDLPDLGARLRTWLATLGTRRVLLIPGGGAAVDLVRHAAATGSLDETTCHWLALSALQFTGKLLAARLQNGMFLEDLAQREAAWQQSWLPVLDVHRFATQDERTGDALPHSWAATSDSFAARIALVANISHLFILKSCALPADCTWPEAARQGIVDPLFPRLMAQAGARLCATVVNLREAAPSAASAAIPPARTP